MTLVINLFILVFLEAVLSMDNALALALIVRHLPEHQQKKALVYGMWGAYAFRILSLFMLSVLLKFTWIKLLGAIYLLRMVWKFYTEDKEGDEPNLDNNHTFWKTIFLVEMTDIAFSIDSILASVAVNKNLWFVLAGGVIGITLMRIASGYLIKLLDAYPKLEPAAYQLVGVVGIKLALEAFSIELSPFLIYPLMGVIIAMAFLPKRCECA